jgi:hypothetical protein
MQGSPAVSGGSGTRLERELTPDDYRSVNLTEARRPAVGWSPVSMESSGDGSWSEDVIVKCL